MLLFNLVCSISLLIAANLNSLVPLVKIIYLLKYGNFAGKYEDSAMKYKIAFGGLIYVCVGAVQGVEEILKVFIFLFIYYYYFLRVK